MEPEFQWGRSGEALPQTSLSVFIAVTPLRPSLTLRLECSVAAPCRWSVLLAPPEASPHCPGLRPLLLRNALRPPALHGRLDRHRAVLSPALHVAALLVAL